MTEDEDRWLDVEATYAYLNEHGMPVTLKAVKHLATRRQLPFTTPFGGRRIFVKLSVLKKTLDQGLPGTTPERHREGRRR